MRFKIVPFVTCPGIPHLTGNLTRVNNRLRVEFLPAAYPNISWPAPHSTPKRVDELWQSTCFECFIGNNRDASYIEINASPEGHWQAYHLSDYRTNLILSKDTMVSTQITSSEPARTSVILDIDISNPQFVTEDWKISVCAVLKDQNNKLYYFAGEHPRSQPDFHLSELRTLDLRAHSTHTT